MKQPGLFDHLPLSERPMFRRSDPATSEVAALAVRDHVGRIQRLVLEVYRAHGPMSARAAEKLEEFKGYGFSTIRKRISELAHAGILVESGVDMNGRAPAAVYRLAVEERPRKTKRAGVRRGLLNGKRP